MEKTYAQALVRAVENGLAPEEAIRRVRELLQVKGHEKLVPKIAREMERLSQHLARRTSVVLTVAKKEDGDMAIAAAVPFLERQRIDRSQVQVAQDPSIIGGWTLNTPSARVDASFKRQLLALYHKIIA